MDIHGRPHRSRLTAGLAVAVLAIAAGSPFVSGTASAPGQLPEDVFDNGIADGVAALPNGTARVFGGRRSVLEDFDAGQQAATLLRFRAVWDTLPPGAGIGIELRFREDACGVPGRVLHDANVASYREVPTGNTVLGRPEFEGVVEFDAIPMRGRYWLEASVIGPEPNLWLTSVGRNGESWVNYDDAGGLQPSHEAFGDPRGLAFALNAWPTGSFSASCCLPGGECAAWTLEDECLELGGRVIAFNGECENVQCPDLAACCLSDGQCLGAETADECFALGGCSFDPVHDCVSVACAPSGACCLPEGGCVPFATPAECAATGGAHESAMTCAVCRGPGACCLSDGSCTDAQLPAACAGLGGTYAGDGVSCGDVSCFGACCLATGCVDGVSEQDCLASGGLPGAPGGTCADVECATGACCLSDGTCTDDVLLSECAGSGGSFRGAASTCAGVTCAPFGACCLDGGGCVQEVTSDTCAASGGWFRGETSRCVTEPCATVTVCVDEEAEIQGSRIGRKSTFGHALAFDQGRLIVGAADAGQLDDVGAYLFERQGDAWTEIAQFRDAQDPARGLGWDVDLAGDLALVSWIDDGFDRPDGVIAYRESDGSWTEEVRFEAMRGSFGWSVATTGDAIVIGVRRALHGSYSGDVRVFPRDPKATSGWGDPVILLSSSPGDLHEFGWAVDADADTIVVGEPNSDVPFSFGGAADVFQRNPVDPDSWIHVRALRPSDARPSMRFGRAVAIQGDRIVIGAPKAESAYVFERDAGGEDHWGETAMLTRPAGVVDFGLSVAVSGDVIVIGANTGSENRSMVACVFERHPDSGLWISRARIAPRADGVHYEPRLFESGGGAVAVDAAEVAVGAPGHDVPCWLDDPECDLGAVTVFAVGPCVGCPADITRDGVVGFADLLAVLATWGPCDGCPEDVDVSGAVGFEDLLAVLSAWGPCAP